MSSRDPAEIPPDTLAFEELEVLVRALGEDLARFRKRAMQSEARLKEIETSGGAAADLFSNDRVASLEAENRELRKRLERAAGRTKAMLDRVRFLRQQTAAGREA